MAFKLILAAALCALCLGQVHPGDKNKVIGLTRLYSSEQTDVWTVLGYTLEHVDDATWRNMTASDFSSYAAISIMDADCQDDQGLLDILEETGAFWGPLVNGPVIVIGTDEAYHYTLDDMSYRGKKTMEGLGNFVVSDPTKLGAYISLSCFFQDTPPANNKAVVFLDNAFTGPFRIAGVNADETYAINAAHIVSSHPALSTLNDGILSGWNQSVHEYFLGDVPGFIPLAIVEPRAGRVGWFNATDGTQGAPYILARGTVYVTDITLTASTPVALINTQVTYTATVTGPRGADNHGLTVKFIVTSGPNAGQIGTGVTDNNGIATLQFTGTVSGLDTIIAQVIIPTGTLSSSSTTVDWAAPQETTAAPTTPGVTDSPSDRSSKSSTSSGKSGSSGQSVKPTKVASPTNSPKPPGSPGKLTTVAPPPVVPDTITVGVRCNKDKFSGSSLYYFKKNKCTCSPARTQCVNCVQQWSYTPAYSGNPAVATLIRQNGCTVCTKAGWLYNGACVTSCPSGYYAVARKKPSDQFQCKKRK